MSALAGLRTSEDPGLDMRRLALTGTVTALRPRARRWLRLWSIFGPLGWMVFSAGMLAGTAIVVLQSGVTP